MIIINPCLSTNRSRPCFNASETMLNSEMSWACRLHRWRPRQRRIFQGIGQSLHPLFYSPSTTHGVSTRLLSCRCWLAIHYDGHEQRHLVNCCEDKRLCHEHVCILRIEQLRHLVTHYDGYEQRHLVNCCEDERLCHKHEHTSASCTSNSWDIWWSTMISVVTL